MGVIKKLEKLYLQQNSITDVPPGFKQLIKLKELRLDRNKLQVVSNLNCCTSLRIIDVSYNRITSLEGLSGLQSLVELRINNNAIRSLRPLKGFPSLREVDCSYNKLKSLDGLQFMTVINIVHAEHNQIVTLQLGGEKDDKRSTPSGESKSVQANRLNEMTNAFKQSRKGSSSSLALSAGKGKPNNIAQVEEPKLGVTELHLHGNRLKSLEAIYSFGHDIEVLDVSANNLASDIDSIVSRLQHLSKLNEIRFDGNPEFMTGASSEGSLYEELQSTIVSSLPSVLSVDTCAVVGGKLIFNQSKADDDSSLKLIKTIESSLNIQNEDSPGSQILNPDGTISHTWQNKGEDSTVLAEKEADENDADTREDEETKKMAEEDEAAAKKGSGLNIDMSMLTEEQITEIEDHFTNLLHECRDRLNSLPRPPSKDKDFDDVGQLSSMYTDLAGRNTSRDPIVTEKGRKTSKNLMVHDEAARALMTGLLSPSGYQKPPTSVVKCVKEKIATELYSPHKSMKSGRLDDQKVGAAGVSTTASSLVTNVLMTVSPKGEENGPKRSSSLKDINVDAFSRKDGVEDV